MLLEFPFLNEFMNVVSKSFALVNVMPMTIMVIAMAELGFKLRKGTRI